MQHNAVALSAGAPIAGIVPRSIEEVFRLAQGIAASGLAPSSLATPEKITVAILTGLEIGLPPMFALSKIAVINGRPALWGDALPALLWARGFKLREWTEDTTSHCEVTRPDGEKIVRSFSDADAKAAGLLGKAGPWTQYKPRMRQMRARGFACRDGAADVLGGLYVAEEIDVREEAAPQALIIEDIPDIPDAPAEAEQTQEVVEDDLADPEGFLANLQEQRDLCGSESDLAEVREANADLMARLSPEHRERAEEILSVE